VENRVNEIPGIRECSLLLNLAPVETGAEHLLCINAGRALRDNTKLIGCVIRVSYFNKALLLEGHVNTLFQKSLAFFKIAYVTRKMNIENKLRIIPEK